MGHPGRHNEQMNWRNKKLAADWDMLVAQVWRWQSVEKLNWREAEVADVARDLNQTIFRHTQTSQRASGLSVPSFGR